MSVTDEYLKNNEIYASQFNGPLPLPPAKHIAVLACMDARINVYAALGIQEGESHVIRNAGGVVTEDEIRSLAISQRLLGTKEIILIHHTDCGMEFFTNEVMSGLLASSLETAALGANGFTDIGKGPGSTEGRYINWLTIADQAGAVVEDVARIRNHSLVPSGIPIYGYVYDVRTGRLVEIPEATKVGQAS